MAELPKAAQGTFDELLAGGSGTRPATEWCPRSGPRVHSAPHFSSRRHEQCGHFAQRNPAADASPMLLGAPFWSIAYTPASSPNPPLPKAKLPPRSVVPGSP